MNGIKLVVTSLNWTYIVIGATLGLAWLLPSVRRKSRQEMYPGKARRRLLEAE